MLFTEPPFLFLFLPLLLGLYFLPAWRPARAPAGAPVRSGGTASGFSYRNRLLIVASVIFYARGAGAFTWFVLGSIAFNYYAALGIDRLRGTPAATPLLRGAVAVNLLSLGVLKYTNFLAANVNALLGTAGFAPVAVPAVLLPIGISFFTFHAISYVVDVYRGQAVAQKGPVETALYLLLFPQLIAGPIIRYREIASQLTSRMHGLEDFSLGVRRFIVGLAKKMLVANIVAGPADQIFALPPDQLTAAHAWLAVGCYTLQIYFDFSGYSDMAIGLGRMFGFHFPENFRYPYTATSVQDFWRRWHISLSAWFRDYLYIPLGGNRTSGSRLYVNLVTVFFLCGLWHGASWTFVVWGLFHGLFLVLERIGLGRRIAKLRLTPPSRFASRHLFARSAGVLPAALRHAYLLIVVMTGWVFFRAVDLAGALGMLRTMAGFGAGAPTPFAPSWYVTPEVCVAIAAGILGSTPLVPALESWCAGRERTDLPFLPSAAATVLLMLLLVGSMMLIAARTYNPFIYFRF